MTTTRDATQLATRQTIALVAHDNCKDELMDWAEQHRWLLREHDLVATGTTGSILTHELGLQVECVNSGPLGGDVQLGARLVQGEIHMLVFLWDPLEQQPHDPDVKALLRLATLCNVPAACNRATADHIVRSLAADATVTGIGRDQPLEVAG